MWDGEKILAETDTGNSTVARYTLNPQLYGELVSQSGLFHHGVYPERSRRDALGSSMQLTDATQGAVVSYLYRAFGEQTVLSGSSASRFNWLGKHGYYRQPDSSDYWVRARIYKPNIGRWVSRDPLCRSGHMRAPSRCFTYCLNRPMQCTDPSGLKCETAWGSYGSGKCGNRKQTKLERTAKCEPKDLNLLWENFEFCERRRDAFCAGREPREEKKKGGRGGGEALIARLECCEDDECNCKGFIRPGEGWGAVPGCIQECFVQHEHVHKGHCEADRLRMRKEWIDSECAAHKVLCNCLAAYINELDSVEPW